MTAVEKRCRDSRDRNIFPPFRFDRLFSFFFFRFSHNSQLWCGGACYYSAGNFHPSLNGTPPYPYLPSLDSREATQAPSHVHGHLTHCPKKLQYAANGNQSTPEASEARVVARVVHRVVVREPNGRNPGIFNLERAQAWARRTKPKEVKG